MLVQLDQFETGVITQSSAFLFHHPLCVSPLAFLLQIPVFSFVSVTMVATCSALFTHIWLKVCTVHGGAVEVPFDQL